VPLIILPWVIFTAVYPGAEAWDSVFFSWNLMYAMMQLGQFIDFFLQNKKRFDLEKERYDIIREHKEVTDNLKLIHANDPNKPDV